MLKTKRTMIERKMSMDDISSSYPFLRIRFSKQNILNREQFDTIFNSIQEAEIR